MGISWHLFMSLCVCVCVCVRACVRACVCVCVRAYIVSSQDTNLDSMFQDFAFTRSAHLSRHSQLEARCAEVSQQVGDMCGVCMYVSTLPHRNM